MDWSSLLKRSVPAQSTLKFGEVAGEQVQMRAVMAHDIIGNRPLEQVAKASPQHYLMIVSALDRMVNPQPSLAWAAAKGAPTYISQGACAHITMSCDAAAVSTRVQAFLSDGKLP